MKGCTTNLVQGSYRPNSNLPKVQSVRSLKMYPVLPQNLNPKPFIQTTIRGEVW